MVERTMVFAVAAGGTLGAAARWSIAEALGPTAGFPWPTFVVNVVGCALLGWISAHHVEHVRAAVGTGFCGGLTTFSTFAVEVVTLGQDERTGLAVGYVVASVLAGLLAAAVGHVGGRRS